MMKRKRGRAGRALPRWDEYFEKWEGGGRRHRATAPETIVEVD